MYSPKRQRTPGTGDTATPIEVNEELRAVLAQVNGGLDLENVDGAAITDAKVATGQFHKVSATVHAGTYSQALSDSVNPNSIMAVPDNAGKPIIISTTVEEQGELLVRFSASLDRAAGQTPSHFYIQVDGVVIAKLDAAEALVGTITVDFEGRVSLPAGSHVIEILHGFGIVAGFGSSSNLVWRERGVLVDWVFR